MKNYKTQFSRITDTFISVTAVITAAILIASGLAVTKINTEYMETGVKTAKIVAERENEEIFISMNGKKFSTQKNMEKIFDTVLYFLPAPVNALIYIGKETQLLLKDIFD